MKPFARYLIAYISSLDLRAFTFTTVFLAVLIFLNYHFGIERNIQLITAFPSRVFVFAAFYVCVLLFPYFLQMKKGKMPSQKVNPYFYLTLLLAAVIFALKIVHWNLLPVTTKFLIAPWDRYFSIVLELPAKLIFIVTTLFLLQKSIPGIGNIFGSMPKDFSFRPYALLLCTMIPLVALAAMRPDFQHTYPRLKAIDFMDLYTQHRWFTKVIYELSYGGDFISIELFFRGLLVLGLMQFGGTRVILPMAAFYCTIHFGKPMAECISAYFGGIILGVIAQRTRSIIGGLTIHLGLAALMEIAGYLAGIYHHTR